MRWKLATHALVSALHQQPRAVTEKRAASVNWDPSIASSIQDTFTTTKQLITPELGEIGRMSVKHFWRMTKGKVLEGVFGNPLPLPL